jgi:hypothetical protein
MRLRTPSRTTRWWQRWFRRTSAGIPYHASDAVVAARLGRTVTIATSLFTALVGITGTVTAATLSDKNSARQLASENDRSANEFLRNQRQAAYTAFAAEAYATVQALVDANFLFLPSRPPPTLEDFSRVNRDVQSHLEKLNSAGLNLELVASDDVCYAGVNEYRALSNASEQHVRAALPYVTGEKPPDDRYRKVWMTDNDNHALRNMFIVFTRAAREDLSDPALRKPAKNCP